MCSVAACVHIGDSTVYRRNFALVNKAIKENLSFFTVVGPKEDGLHRGVRGEIFTSGVFGDGTVWYSQW